MKTEAKSYWWLLLDIPLFILLLLPAAVVAFLAYYIWAGWLFGADLFEKQFTKVYPKLRG